ncbi:hypothetical protein NPIL_257421, partial [Nephila pilipes]
LFNLTKDKEENRRSNKCVVSIVEMSQRRHLTDSEKPGGQLRGPNYKPVAEAIRC